MYGEYGTLQNRNKGTFRLSMTWRIMRESNFPPDSGMSLMQTLPEAAVQAPPRLHWEPF